MHLTLMDTTQFIQKEKMVIGNCMLICNKKSIYIMKIQIYRVNFNLYCLIMIYCNIVFLRIFKIL
jgi:hypothetical protein